MNECAFENEDGNIDAEKRKLQEMFIRLCHCEYFVVGILMKMLDI